MTALQEQVGGSHYTAMKKQPIELAYELKASPCFCKLAKYLTRDKGTRLQDLQKALHVISLEEILDTSAYGCAYGYGEEEIKEFTDDYVIYKILRSMYEGDYREATAGVHYLIKCEFPDETVE